MIRSTFHTLNGVNNIYIYICHAILWLWLQPARAMYDDICMHIRYSSPAKKRRYVETTASIDDNMAWYHTFVGLVFYVFHCCRAHCWTDHPRWMLCMSCLFLHHWKGWTTFRRYYNIPQLSHRFSPWRQNRLCFSKDHHIIGINPRGFCTSTLNQVFEDTTDINLCLEKIGIDKTMVLGFSSGGPTASYMTLLYPEKD